MLRLRWTNDRRKSIQTHLHHSTAKNFKPWIVSGTVCYHPLCCMFHILMHMWQSTQTRTIYRSATSCSKNSQNSRQNPLGAGHNRSQTPSKDTTPRYENASQMYGPSYLGHTSTVKPPQFKLTTMNLSKSLTSPIQPEFSHAGVSAYQNLTLKSSIMLKESTGLPMRSRDNPPQVKMKP